MSTFGREVERHEIGPLSFVIKKLPAKRKYTLWLNGCRIGKPLPNGEIHEFTASTVTEARCELSNAAKREIRDRIAVRESEIKKLKTKLHGNAMAKLDQLLWAAYEHHQTNRTSGGCGD